MDFFSLSLIAGAIVTAIVVIGIIMTSLYTRSTRDKAYVRTGLGGKKSYSTAAQSFCRSSTPIPGSRSARCGWK